MAQKTHPIAIRLNGVNPWKFSWITHKSSSAFEFTRQLSAYSYIKRFYKANGFSLLTLRSEKTDQGVFYFMTLRVLKLLGSAYALRFSHTLPLGLRVPKKKSVVRYYDQRANSLNITNNDTPVLHPYPELSVLSKGLRKITGSDAILIKSHPSFYSNCNIPAEYLSVFLRDQLLAAAKRKKRLVPLKYFRSVSSYIERRLPGQCKGIRIQIKGRVPRLGSSGAARSKLEVASLGHLSLQRVASPIDYGHVDLRTRSGISSIRVWISYKSPIDTTTPLKQKKISY